MAADKPIELPAVLYKPEGQYATAKTEEQYDAAIADGWETEPPKDWSNAPDPENPGGTLPQKEVGLPEGKTDDSAKGAKGAKSDKASKASVLDGTVPDVEAAVAKMTDLRAVQALRLEETKGKDRAGVLSAIDARIAELKG